MTLTGGAGEFGAGYRARSMGIGLSCMPDEAFVEAVREAVAAGLG